MNTYIVKSGDCFASIAKQFGFHDADMIYQHPANAELKKQRANLHVLKPGDKVCIPDKKTKTIELTPDVCTVLTIKGLLTELKLLIEDFDGNPLVNTEYQLDVVGTQYLGRTDDSGMLVEKIDASAKKATLILFLDVHKKDCLFWPLELGGLTPHSDICGMQARLNNLGYYCANESGDIDSSTKNAINAFKTSNGLTNDSVIDQALISKLASVYGI